MNKARKKIFLTGGLTAGPLGPWTAALDYLFENNPNVLAKVYILDTPDGVGKIFAQSRAWDFLPFRAPKLPRYKSLQLLWLPFAFIGACIQALIVIFKYRPNLILGAGGFVQVPLVFAAAVFKIPILIHNQDRIPSLSNRIAQWFAHSVTLAIPTTSYVGTVSGLGNQNTPLSSIGNPVRKEIRQALSSDREEAIGKLGLNPNRPVLFITGGGTGSIALNNWVKQFGEDILAYTQIIHSFGSKSRMPDLPAWPGYIGADFFEEMATIYAASDIVWSRAGMGSISEIAYLRKPCILTPMPGTHQEANAQYVEFPEGGAYVIEQKFLKSEAEILDKIKKILYTSGETTALANAWKTRFPQTAHRILAEKVSAYLK